MAESIEVHLARIEGKLDVVDAKLAPIADHEARLRVLEAQPAPLTAQKLWSVVVAGSSTVAALSGVLAFFITKGHN